VARILGVDLGTVRIGLALSDPTETLASPLAVLRRSGDEGADRRAVVGAAHEHEATRIVVGLPRSLDGTEGPAARAARAEIAELAAVAGDDLPVEAYDERLTTVIADRALAASGRTGRRRRQVVDQVAAAVMLQGYLDRHRG